MLQNHSTCYYIVQWYVLVESAKEVSGVGTGTESLPTICYYNGTHRRLLLDLVRASTVLLATSTVGLPVL